MQPRRGKTLKSSNLIDDAKQRTEKVVEALEDAARPTQPRRRRPTREVSEQLAGQIDAAGRAAERAIDDPVGTAQDAYNAGSRALNEQVETTRDFVKDQADQAGRFVEQNVNQAKETANEYYESAEDAANCGRW